MWLFLIAALVYAKTLKKSSKNLKHRQSCVKATLMKSGTGAPTTTAEAAADREAATEQIKKPTRTHEGNERVLSNARNQNVRKTKKIYT